LNLSKTLESEEQHLQKAQNDKQIADKKIKELEEKVAELEDKLNKLIKEKKVLEERMAVCYFFTLNIIIVINI